MVHEGVSNECVGCPQGCVNCGAKHVKYYEFECDECGDRAEDLVLYQDEDGTQLCLDCLLERYEKVEV